MNNLARSNSFADMVAGFDALLKQSADEAGILAAGDQLLRKLIARDDWLPDEFAQPHPERYTQYLLYRDPDDRFSVVSFVWGPGQKTPIHDHTVWGMVGVLRGAEFSQRFKAGSNGMETTGGVHRLEAGQVEAVSPTVGDIHQVTNAFEDRVSISIHVYGADIGKVSRHTYAPDGTPKTFISGYANAEGPVLLAPIAAP